MTNTKIILDVCCGSRMFWFDKENKDVLFVDNRTLETTLCDGRKLDVKPEKVMDFRKLDLPDDSFHLVVFDPPHIVTLGKESWMAKKYGRLDKESWKDDLTKGFSECFRVLKKNGVLVFKWNESEILVKEVLLLTPVKPLFGHPSGKLQKTHWVAFIK